MAKNILEINKTLELNRSRKSINEILADNLQEKKKYHLN